MQIEKTCVRRYTIWKFLCWRTSFFCSRTSFHTELELFARSERNSLSPYWCLRRMLMREPRALPRSASSGARPAGRLRRGLLPTRCPAAKLKIRPFSKGCRESGTNLIFLHRWGGKVDSRRFAMVVWNEKCPFSCFRHFFGFGCHNHSNSLPMYVAPARRWSTAESHCVHSRRSYLRRSFAKLMRDIETGNVFSFPALKMFYPFFWIRWVYNFRKEFERFKPYRTC